VTEPEDQTDIVAPQIKRKERSEIKALRVILAVVSVAFVVWSLVRDREALMSALSFSGSEILTIFALLILYFISYAYRFVVLIDKHCRCRIDLLTWTRMLVVVRFMNNLVPQMGSVYRGITLKRDYGVSYTDFISANVFFIWTDTLFNFLLAIILVVAVGAHLDLFGMPVEQFLLFAFIGILVSPLLASKVLAYVPQSSRFLKKLAHINQQLLEGLKDPKYMLGTTAIALVSFGLMAWVFKLLLLGVEVDVPLSTLAVFYALYRLTFHVNITPGNIGVRELAYGLLCSEAHIGMAKGLLISTELRILSVLVLLIVGMAVSSKEIVSTWRTYRKAGRAGLEAKAVRNIVVE
jgi:uncharacterized membrane protein YbhN (UPF0104 family)